MADFKLILPHIEKWEGGKVNHPADPGGATNKGITFKTYQAYAAKFGLPVGFDYFWNKLTNADWQKFVKLYWDWCKAAQIKDQRVAEMLVDWFWGSGIYAIQRAKKALATLTPKQDEFKATWGASDSFVTNINSVDPDKYVQALYDARAQHYADIVKNRPASSVFLKGWMNRLNSLVDSWGGLPVKKKVNS